MVKIKEGWPASSPLVQEKTERFDDGCLASVILSQQDVHARSELNGQIGKAPEIMNANLGQEHVVPKGTTQGLQGMRDY